MCVCVCVYVCVCVCVSECVCVCMSVGVYMCALVYISCVHVCMHVPTGINKRSDSKHQSCSKSLWYMCVHMCD